MQFYIVAGGSRKHGPGRQVEAASTEILKKDGGTSWQTVASLPSARGGLRGVSLPNGHFMVSGEDTSTSFMTLVDASLQEVQIRSLRPGTVWLTWWITILMKTSGPRWARWPRDGQATA